MINRRHHSLQQKDLLQDIEEDIRKSEAPAVSGHLFSRKTKWAAAGLLSGAVTFLHENLSNMQDMGQHARALTAGAETFGLLAASYCVTNVAVNFISKKLTGNPATHYFLPRLAGLVIGMSAFLGNAVPPVFDATAKLFDAIETNYSIRNHEITKTAQEKKGLVLCP